jgi:hypothetical protein
MCYTYESPNRTTGMTVGDSVSAILLENARIRFGGLILRTVTALPTAYDIFRRVDALSVNSVL